jgi:hypothetical protein
LEKNPNNNEKAQAKKENDLVLATHTKASGEISFPVF